MYEWLGFISIHSFRSRDKFGSEKENNIIKEGREIPKGGTQNPPP